MVLLAPHGEIAAADHPMDDVNYGIVHPKNSGVPDMVRVAYGSEYLEEKVWAHIFWQGTGGFYPKTAAAAGWSRRDYVKYRLLMVINSLFSNADLRLDVVECFSSIQLSVMSPRGSFIRPIN